MLKRILDRSKPKQKIPVFPYYLQTHFCFQVREMNEHCDKLARNLEREFDANEDDLDKIFEREEHRSK